MVNPSQTCFHPYVSSFSDCMPSSEPTTRLNTHGVNIWGSIAKVGELDKDLADELTEEYGAFLQAMCDILDEWSHRFDHEILGERDQHVS